MVYTQLPDGSIEFFDIINSQTVRRKYMGYSLTQAKKLFKAYCKQIKIDWLQHLAK